MTSAGSRGLKACLFLVSLCLLCLEILHIRIFGYVMAPVLSYCAITFAMLGVAGGAAVLSMLPGIMKRNVPGILAGLCIAFGLSVLLSAWLLTLMPARTEPVERPDVALELIYYFLPSILPYLLAGLAIAMILSALPAMSGEVYFLNLAGSAIGCLIPVAALRIAGVENLLAFTGLGAIAAALPLTGSFKRSVRAGVVLVAALWVIVVIPQAGRIFAFKPDPLDQISVLTRMRARQGEPPPRREFEQWDPVGKIEVYRMPGSRVKLPEPADYRIITVDAGASTLMIRPPDGTPWGRKLFEESLYGIGYHVTTERPDVLVIGAGGGTDIHTALHWSARSVTGVEISRTTIDLLRDRYRDFAGIMDGRGAVELVHADGRNFAKHTDRRFDLIQLTGVDTLTLASPGAMVLVEDYLYTVEAFKDFLGILEPGGTLVVLRFGKEAYKLGMIAYRALELTGARQPMRHMALLSQQRLAGVVVKNEPLSQEQMAALRKAASRRTPNDISIPHYDAYHVGLGTPISVLYLPADPYLDRLRQKLRSVEGSAVSGALADLKTPSDDKPYYMAGRIFNKLRMNNAVRSIRLVRDTWIMVLVLSGLFLFLPLARGRKSYPLRLSSAPLLLFFLSIAVGFMFIEIGLIQKTIIFVGYPGGSAALVLAAILLGTGAGSYVSGRLRSAPSRNILLIAPVVFAVILAYALSVEKTFQVMAGLDAAARWAACCALIALAGVPMGFMFPSGLRTALGTMKPIIPWAISVNGFASAAASVAALPVGILKGHRFLMIAGAVCYLLAMLWMLLFCSREGIWKRT